MQRVWDPLSRRVVPLRPFPEGHEDGNEMDYVGPHIPDDLAVKICTGILFLHDFHGDAGRSD